MTSFLKFAFIMSVFTLPMSAFAQTSNPEVLAIIGDVSSKDARKALKKQVKLRPKKKHCKAGEWEKVGFRHAFEGYLRSEGKSIMRKRCGKHDITYDEARYDQGFSEGILKHCGYETGIRQGGNTRELDGGKRECGTGQFQTFEIGYRVGEAHNKMVTEKNGHLRTSEEAKADFDRYYALVVNGERTFEQRAELGRLEAEHKNSRREYEKMKQKIAVFETEYHAGKIFSSDLPDAELTYKIPTYP